MTTRDHPRRQAPGVGRSDPGVPSRWLFHYHEDMVAEPLRLGTTVPRMTIGEEFIREHVQTWAPDLLSFPLFSPAFCRFLLDAADVLGEWRSADPALPLDRITPRLSAVITQIVGRHVNPLLRRVFMNMHVVEQVETPQLVRHAPAPPATGAREVQTSRHAGLRFVVALTAEHEGGGLRFPRQHAVVDALPVGHALMIPGGPSHWHERVPVTAGVRRELSFATRAGRDDE